MSYLFYYLYEFLFWTWIHLSKYWLKLFSVSLAFSLSLFLLSFIIHFFFNLEFFPKDYFLYLQPFDSKASSKEEKCQKYSWNHFLNRVISKSINCYVISEAIAPLKILNRKSSDWSFKRKPLTNQTWKVPIINQSELIMNIHEL